MWPVKPKVASSVFSSADLLPEDQTDFTVRKHVGRTWAGFPSLEITLMDFEDLLSETLPLRRVQPVSIPSAVTTQRKRALEDDL